MRSEPSSNARTIEASGMTASAQQPTQRSFMPALVPSVAASAASAAAPRRPVAMSRPTSSRSAVGPSTTATISPRYITATRSDSSRTSSSSADTSRMAAPASRLAMTWRWMNSMLPTSRPRVGWSRIEGRELAAELAGHDRLLLVPAGQRAGRRRSRTGSGCRTRRWPAWPRRRSPRRCGRCRASTGLRRTG